MDKEDMVCKYIGMLLSHEKGWNTSICIDMDEPWRYYAKWKKSDGERKIPHNFTHVWILKK